MYYYYYYYYWLIEFLSVCRTTIRFVRPRDTKCSPRYVYCYLKKIHFEREKIFDSIREQHTVNITKKKVILFDLVKK